MAYVSLGADSFRQDEIREARRRQARIEREAPSVGGDMAVDALRGRVAELEQIVAASAVETTA